MKTINSHILAAALVLACGCAHAQQTGANRNTPADPSTAQRSAYSTGSVSGSAAMDQETSPRADSGASAMTGQADPAVSASSDAMTRSHGAKSETASMKGGMPASAFYPKAVKGGRTEIELSQIALDKSQDTGIRDVAQMVVTDHTSFNSKLQQASKTGSAAQSAGAMKEAGGADPAVKQKLASASGAAFDKAYLATMAQDHKKAIALFETASTGSSDAEVRRLATEALPTLRKHAQAVAKLQSKMGQ